MRKIYFGELTENYVFPTSRFTLTKEKVDSYIKSINGTNDLYKQGIVPPMAVVALAITALGESFEIAPGTVHVSQQLQFFKNAAINEELSSLTSVIKKVSRGKFNMLTVKMDIKNSRNDTIISGETGFILPMA